MPNLEENATAREPTGTLREEIEQVFGSYQEFKDEFTKQALAKFGSGELIFTRYFYEYVTGFRESFGMRLKINITYFGMWPFYTLNHSQGTKRLFWDGDLGVANGEMLVGTICLHPWGNLWHIGDIIYFRE